MNSGYKARISFHMLNMEELCLAGLNVENILSEEHFHESREELYSPQNEYALDLCERFMTKLHIQNSGFNENFDSYQLKSVIERLSALDGQGQIYIPNGIVILAASIIGFDRKSIKGSLNCHFNIDQNDYENLDRISHLVEDGAVKRGNQ